MSASTSAPAPFPVATHRPGASRRVVLLPGARYPTRAPLLWFAREIAVSRGYGALEVLDEPAAGDDPFAWVRDRATRALDHEPTALDVVIGKSLSSDVADLAVARGLPAVWLTPLLDRPTVVDALARARRPTLLIGSNADPTWRPERLARNPAVELLELDGLDHALQLPGDPQRSLRELRAVVKRIDRFLGALD